jgi:hemerythrin-like metal-binding protein
VTPINWDASLETGDAAVDHQHRTIHNLFNQLERSAGHTDEVMRILDFLTEHVLVHFATEEELMLREEFPPALATAHIAEHRTLTQGVRDQVLAFRCGRLTSTKPLIGFLREWLVTHVHACDRQLVEHVQARGVTVQLPPAWIIAEERASA